MKKEYNSPQMGIVAVEKEFMISGSGQDYTHIDAKKNGRGFVDDEEEVPAAEPKKFWDDED